MLGDDALWLPGTDHAGLATHQKILEEMAAQKMDPSDRASYLKTGWHWKERYHGRITSQIRKMGAACDWERERFTLDADYQASATEAFRRLWEEGFIAQRDDQWILDLPRLCAPLRAALASGELAINPSAARNRLEGFLRQLEPWTISRQIGWGMRIPLSCKDGSWQFDPSGDKGDACTDTLDTWFMSALWPIATLGWPHATPDMERYYPGEWMETGEDILFFWCAKMWAMCHFLTGKGPFKRIFLHGLIRDKHGNKMSKSLGNGIDPLDLMERRGTDALRWHLALRAEPGKDMRFSEQGWLADTKWLGKPWNAARFLLQFGPPTMEKQCPQDLAELGRALYQDFAHDRYPDAARRLQEGMRGEFCSGWIEASKEELRNGSEALRQEGWDRLRWLLRFLHPFAPFMTSELHEQLGLGDTDLPLDQRRCG
jgi:valyl-tRNA synthetase